MGARLREFGPCKRGFRGAQGHCWPVSLPGSCANGQGLGGGEPRRIWEPVGGSEPSTQAGSEEPLSRSPSPKKLSLSELAGQLGLGGLHHGAGAVSPCLASPRRGMGVAGCSGQHGARLGRG